MVITRDLIDSIPLNGKLDSQSRSTIHAYRWEQFALVFDASYPELYLKILGLYNHRDSAKKFSMLNKINSTDFKFRYKLNTSLSYAGLVSIPHNEFNKTIIKLSHYIKDKPTSTIYSWFK